MIKIARMLSIHHAFRMGNYHFYQSSAAEQTHLPKTL
jgi:hypothetical protein